MEGLDPVVLESPKGARGSGEAGERDELDAEAITGADTTSR